MKVYLNYAAYIPDVDSEIIKDLIRSGLYKDNPENNSHYKLNTFMIPLNDLKDFISSYHNQKEYIRARYRIIFNYISDCVLKIKNEIPYNNDIQHVFFIKKESKN